MFISRCWHRLTHQMPTLGRTSSTCSTSSSISSKSVSFGEMDTVFYTHSSNEYDRSAARESRDLHASLGRIYLSEPEMADMEVDPQQDFLVQRNTVTNGRRNSQGYAVMLDIKYSRSP